MLFIFDPKDHQAFEAIKKCIEFIKSHNLVFAIEFHIVPDPEDACAFIRDDIRVSCDDYKTYKQLILESVKLYTGENVPDYVILIGDG